MIDLKKKPLPDHRDESRKRLVAVLREIAEKSEMEKLLKRIEADIRLGHSVTE